MKRFIHALCLIVICSVGLSSCLNGDDTDTTVYQETSINRMSVLAVNRYIHTLSKSGQDSVYKKTITTSPTFTIDQTKYEIYNLDSLPYDCDMKHVLISLTGSTYSGTIFIKSIDKEDEMVFYSSADSLDFTTPRVIRVYNNNLSIYREYKLTINKHQVPTEKILWKEYPVTDFPDDKEKEDAKWEALVKEAGLETFIGAGRMEAYAYSKDHELMISRDEGKTWDPDLIDSEASLLPVEYFSFASSLLKTDPGDDYQLLVGTNDNHQEACVVWRKIEEHSEYSLPAKWVYMPIEPYNRYYLPAAPDWTLVSFNNDVLAIGSRGLYCTRDGGITWKKDSRYSLPDGLDVFNNISVMTDDDNHLWLMDCDSERAWCGTFVKE